jgi:hypothetical protein
LKLNSGNVGETKVFQTKNENLVAKIQIATHQVYRTKEKKRVEEVTWHEGLKKQNFSFSKLQFLINPCVNLFKRI